MYGSLQGEMAAMLQKYNCDVIMHMRHIFFFYITDISMNQILPKRKSLAKESLRTPYVKRILRCQHSYPRRWSARAFRREYRYDLYLLYVLVIGFMLSTLGLAIHSFL